MEEYLILVHLLLSLSNWIIDMLFILASAALTFKGFSPTLGKETTSVQYLLLFLVNCEKSVSD